MTTVMICVDNSQHSEYAVDFYLQHIHKQGNHVRVVHCPEDWKGGKPMQGPSPGRRQELQQEVEINTNAISKRFKEKFQKAGVDIEFEELCGKEPWEAICDDAKKSGANLIVMGTRGQGTIRRTILGSVSDSVLHHVDCAVLVCHKKESQQQQQQQQQH